MKRLFHLLGQAALLVMMWAVIFEIGLRVQQYFGPLYDLKMASINLNWESNVVNHQPEPEHQNLCIYGDLTGFSYKRSYDANGIRMIDDTARLAGCRTPISVLFLGDPFVEGFDDKNTLPYSIKPQQTSSRNVLQRSVEPASEIRHSPATAYQFDL